MLVLDASIVLAFALEDEDSPVAKEAITLAQKHGARAPVIWWYEVRNVIAVNERKRRISQSDASAIVATIARMKIEIDRETPEEVFGIARRNGLSVYDSAYLELALRSRLPLASLDHSLKRAAKAEGVPLIA